MSNGNSFFEKALPYTEKIRENTTAIFKKGGFLNLFIMYCFSVLLIKNFYEKAGMLIIYDLSTVFKIFGLGIVLTAVLYYIYQPLINMIKKGIEWLGNLSL